MARNYLKLSKQHTMKAHNNFEMKIIIQNNVNKNKSFH